MIAFIKNVSFNKIKHIYKTMIKSNIIYNSTIWHEFKVTKLISQKTINFLTIVQNDCLKRICDVYKTTFIAKLKTEIYISFINIHLNKLQNQNWTKILKLRTPQKNRKKKFIECSKKKHRKSKFISTNSKKTWLRVFNKFIKKQETINAQKNQNQRKKLKNHFVKFWKNRDKNHQTKLFCNFTFARIKKIEKK